MSDPTYQPKIYRENGGDTLHVAAGGSIVIDPGAIIGVQPTITDITAPTTATAIECATTLNAVLDALRAAGMIL